MIKNCKGEEFKVGDVISGLLGFGTFVNGPIIEKEGVSGVMRKDEFIPLEDFEGGFALATSEKKEEEQVLKVGDKMTFCSQKRVGKSITLEQKNGIIKKFRTVKQVLIETRKNKSEWVDLEEVT